MDIIFQRLKQINKNAYAPFSNFTVSAVVLTVDNKMYSGINVENPALGETVCAEKVALTQAYTQGLRREGLNSIHIYAPTTKTTVTPCGSCRQVMLELLPLKAKVYLYNENKLQVVKTVQELMPFGFTSGNLI